jgi:DivIVA domain-containing protein
MSEGSNAATGPSISPADIQRQEFGVSRFGGYRMRDVDEFLDRLTASTEQLLAENERLRRAGGGPIVGTADLSDIDRQADEILQRARDEAARIVEDARRQQAAASIGPLDDAQRAAVDAFLSQERAFLQSLATLVQGHAESVKAMAKQSRRGPERPMTDDADRSAATSASSQREISIPEASDDDDDDDDDDGEETGESAAPSAATERSADQTVVLERSQAATFGERTREDDPSLKQLFWGEER